MSVSVMGKVIVIVNSYTAAEALLDKKGAINANRPPVPAAARYAGLWQHVAFLQMGERHRRHRRLLHQVIGTKQSIEKFYEIEEQEGRKLLRKILASPQDHLKHVRQYVLSAGSIGAVA